MGIIVFPCLPAQTSVSLISPGMLKEPQMLVTTVMAEFLFCSAIFQHLPYAY